MMKEMIKIYLLPWVICVVYRALKILFFRVNNFMSFLLYFFYVFLLLIVVAKLLLILNPGKRIANRCARIRIL